jgi:hypothetical protein
MKRKEDMKKTEDRRPKTGDKNARMQECRNAGMKRKIKTVPGLKQPVTSSQEPAATKENSTVHHNKRLIPVTIEISREEAAITACSFLRFFNN